MKTPFIFDFVEEENRLFLTILTILLMCYVAISASLISLKSDIKSATAEKKNPKRFAKLIMDLPVPVYKAKKVVVAEVKKTEMEIEKKEEKKEKAKEKGSKENKQIEREISSRKAQKENISAGKKMTLQRKQEGTGKNILKSERVLSVSGKSGQAALKDIENLGMLNLITSVDDPGVELADIQGAKELSVEKHSSVNKGQRVSTVFDKEPLAVDEIREDKNEIKIKKTLEKGVQAKADRINSSSKIVIDNKKLKLTVAESNSENISKTGRTRDASEVESIVSGYANGMKFCYNKVLQKEENIRGNIVVKFTILGSGKTKNISISENEIQDKRLESCIIGLIERWEFPHADMDQLVTYPLKFIKNS